MLILYRLQWLWLPVWQQHVRWLPTALPTAAGWKRSWGREGKRERSRKRQGKRRKGESRAKVQTLKISLPSTWWTKCVSMSHCSFFTFLINIYPLCALEVFLKDVSGYMYNHSPPNRIAFPVPVAEKLFWSRMLPPHDVHGLHVNLWNSWICTDQQLWKLLQNKMTKHASIHEEPLIFFTHTELMVVTSQVSLVLLLSQEWRSGWCLR